MKWRDAIERLKEIHPDMRDCRYDEEGFLEIFLKNGERMSSSEFREGSETKKLMCTLEEQRREG